jgi:heme-degrading monooxygenase HmoA
MTKTGFIVIYRWRVHPEKEDAFIRAWGDATEEIAEALGAHGSALLKDDDGLHYAIARWPSREAWLASRGQDAVPSAALRQVTSQAIAERLDPIELDMLDDRWRF